MAGRHLDMLSTRVILINAAHISRYMRELELKVWQGILLGLFFGLLSTGVILLITRMPQGEAVILVPPPTPGPIVVHVSGAVKQPGVYELPRQSRVRDAIQIAGGLTDIAQDDLVNQAARVQDGQKIHVPAVGETPVAQSSDKSQIISIGEGTGNKINLNTASQIELELLPGIGPSKAQNIISYREDNGRFESIEQLKNVPGIGDGILETVRDLIFID